MSEFVNLQKYLENVYNSIEKNHSASHSRMLHTRVSFEELEQIKQNAEILNVNVSEYIRSLALIPPIILDENLDNKQQHFIIFDFKTLEKILALTNNICNDYNRIFEAYKTIKTLGRHE